MHATYTEDERVQVLGDTEHERTPSSYTHATYTEYERV